MLVVLPFVKVLQSIRARATATHMNMTQEGGVRSCTVTAAASLKLVMSQAKRLAGAAVGRARDRVMTKTPLQTVCSVDTQSACRDCKQWSQYHRLGLTALNELP